MNKVFGYHITGFKSVEGYNGNAMRGTLVFGRQKIGTFFVDGKGGATQWTPLVSAEDFETHTKAVRNKYKAVGVRIKHVSPLDCLVDDLVYVGDVVKQAKKNKFGMGKCVSFFFVGGNLVGAMSAERLSTLHDGRPEHHMGTFAPSGSVALDVA